MPICAYSRASRKSYRANALRSSCIQPAKQMPHTLCATAPALPTSFVPYKRHIPNITTYGKKPFSDEQTIYADVNPLNAPLCMRCTNSSSSNPILFVKITEYYPPQRKNPLNIRFPRINNRASTLYAQPAISRLRSLWRRRRRW